MICVSGFSDGGQSQRRHAGHHEIVTMRSGFHSSEGARRALLRYHGEYDVVALRGERGAAARA